MSRHLVCIGGSDAGISAALRAKELDPATDVTVVVADDFPNYSICGLPFLLSGETPDWRDLAHRSRDELEDAGLELRLSTTACAIEPDARRVRLADGGTIGYDQLVIATGAVPRRPPIAGLDQPGVHVLHSMADAFGILDELGAGRRAVVMGGGYIGVELADALVVRGLEVTLLEMATQVLTTVDEPLGALVAAELRRNGVDVRTATMVDAIDRADGRLRVRAGGGDHPADVVVVASGVAPRVELADALDLQPGASGAIGVDRRMGTRVDRILAAGDCVQTHHRLLPEPAYLPLGTTAHKQGRVAGAQAVGHDQVFAGSLGTQVVKIFELVVGRTGLRHDEALPAGFRPFTVELEADDHKAYYPGATRMTIRLTADRREGRLLGAQIVGSITGQVAKRLDVLAAAIFRGLSTADLSDLDLSYTPPLSSPWDPVQAVAQLWDRTGRDF